MQGLDLGMVGEGRGVREDVRHGTGLGLGMVREGGVREDVRHGAGL